MGTWGTAIYSCDIANDVRDVCKEVFAFYDVENGNNIVFSIFKDIIEQDFVDNEYASFWYALADWQWKHGMLTDLVRNKAIDLLKNYAGIDEWAECGNPKDVEKRKNILKALEKQLLSIQPYCKKIKASVARPKHKPGDIIIFNPTISADLESDNWRIKNFNWPIFFESEKFLNSKYEDVSGYNARGKYMAILCIGSVKEQHSQYVENVFDERSLYVWYDYLSATKPTQNILKTSGFLPFILHDYKDFNRKITESVNWSYSFTLACESFRSNEKNIIFSKLQDLSEVKRFNYLFSQKKYSSDYLSAYSLFSMFGTTFCEKNRAELIDERIDNLLSADIINPLLASPSKVDSNRAKELEKLRRHLGLV